MKELNKTIQYLKVEIETITKSKREITLEIENLEKRPGVVHASITNRIQEIEERISGAEDTKENIDITVRENAKCKKDPNLKHPEIPGHNEKTKPKDNKLEQSQDSKT